VKTRPNCAGSVPNTDGCGDSCEYDDKCLHILGDQHVCPQYVEICGVPNGSLYFTSVFVVVVVVVVALSVPW
jgi:hypothetical protein